MNPLENKTRELLSKIILRIGHYVNNSIITLGYPQCSLMKNNFRESSFYFQMYLYSYGAHFSSLNLNVV